MVEGGREVPQESLSFGERLRRYRVEVGLTQEELAEQAGLSTRGLSDLERGVRQTPYRDTVQRLADALNLTGADRVAMLSSVKRARSLHKMDGAALASADMEPSAPVLLQAGLPISLTSFIGRERELAQLQEQLRAGRLLTLTGPGGIGKTRLAVHLATDLVKEFADGVVFVPLAAVSDPSLVAQTIAEHLGVREVGGHAVVRDLHDHLRDKTLLMVLDNFEHLTGAAPLLNEVLSKCPCLKLLITSRAVLHISGEQEYPVQPLELPDPSALFWPDRLGRSEAVRLFVERAQAVDPEFRLGAENALAVAEICRRLEALPLAIELAAARAKVLPPRALLPRLEHRLNLLTGGPRDVPTRQQTLRATIAWSYDLLSGAEQALFRRLSVFPGGWTLAAAESICKESTVLEDLASLLDKSLAHRVYTTQDEPRFSMFETVREYGLEKLEVSGEADDVRRRHAAYFLVLAEAAVPHLETPAQAAWLNQLEAEQSNLRAALRWAVSNGAVERGLRLGGALWLFWFMRNRLTEGREWLEELLALAGGEADRTARATALIGAATLARYQGEYAAARSLAFQALSVRRELGDKQGMADALDTLGFVALYEGDFDTASSLYSEALAVHQQLGNAQGIADSTSHLGLLGFYRGDYDAAAHLQHESLALWRAQGDDFGVAWALSNLGTVTVYLGELDRAEEILRESLEINERLGSTWGIACSLEGMAMLAAKRQRPERALRLAGAAQAIRLRTGTPLSQAGHAALQAMLDGSRRQLGTTGALAAQAAGESLSLEEAVRAARLDEPVGSTEFAQASRSVSTSMLSLSPREYEVAILLARGLTNREIAEALVIGERTVDTHVEHIRTKLGTRTRVAIAAWVGAQGRTVAAGPNGRK